MANVFGNPITDSTLKGMAEYADREITAVDRARMAVNMKNANMKDMNAHTYVENLKRQWGIERSTLCLIYNATGNTMMLVGSEDRAGHIGPVPYPIVIQNGQWGAFLHVGDSYGSTAGVVYRGKNGKIGNDCDYIMAWSNTHRREKNIGDYHSVSTEAREVNHFTNAVRSDLLYQKSQTTCYNYRDSWEGCLSIISTGSGTSPVVEATFTLEDAVNA
ncbi:23 kDa jasmonate-induced protein-like [Rosa rugosa]|uniref:23 kDa jasmonate-induced protein-like n=1 Tax=Rosa rugosa TaxID=74645 RepID=UPI002B406ECC|nr:23 kDa jasmonate-induced protein-like [Rosa rugosa]